MKNIIEEHVILKQEMEKIDKDKLWEYYMPNDPADEETVKESLSKLGVNIPNELIELYQVLNGWDCFFQMVDLFSLSDYFSDKMNYAKTILHTILEYQEEFEINDLLPIAVSRDDIDVFVLVVGGKSFGQVIWFAGGIIERFDSIRFFLTEMLKLSKATIDNKMRKNQEE